VVDVPPPPDVTLVPCTRGGSILGALPPFSVDVSWWSDVAEG
jgi:hypothetical protein